MISIPSIWLMLDSLSTLCRDVTRVLAFRWPPVTRFSGSRNFLCYLRFLMSVCLPTLPQCPHHPGPTGAFLASGPRAASAAHFGSTLSELLEAR